MIWQRLVTIHLAAGLIALCLLCGCSPTYHLQSRSGFDNPAPPQDLPRAYAMADALAPSLPHPAAATALPLALTTGSALGQTPGEKPVRPYLVQTIDISLQVENVTEKSTALQQLVQEHNGYLANLSETSDPIGGTHIQLTLRIPASQLEDMMNAIQGLGRVLRRTMNADDVTLQFVDMQSTLRNLQKMEERLLAHLDHTGTMQDILNVEKEITRVRGEIETLQGRINRLANQIDFATVQVRLEATPAAGPISPVSAFSTGRTFTEAARNLLYFGQGLWIVTIWVGVWIPVWVPLALLLRWLFRRAQRTARAPG